MAKQTVTKTVTKKTLTIRPKTNTGQPKANVNDALSKKAKSQPRAANGQFVPMVK